MPKPGDPYNLERFLEAQVQAYTQARAELAAGQKRSHWMWFIFPQIQGLGSSPMAERYAIAGLAEARTYLAHPVLGPRLLECVALVNNASPRTLDRILGYPDDLKFHSSVTLFNLAANSAEPVFTDALRLFFAGRPDQATVSRLNAP